MKNANAPEPGMRLSDEEKQLIEALRRLLPVDRAHIIRLTNEWVGITERNVRLHAKPKA